MTVASLTSDTTERVVRRAMKRRGTRRRRGSILIEIFLITGTYLVLFEKFIDPMRRFEVDTLAWFFRLFNVRGITAATGDNLLVASPAHAPILAYISPSCSSLMGILALGALATGVLRGRHSHTVVAYVVSASMLFVLNIGRMAASCAAGLWLGHGALLLFHDWVGTVWNFVATLLGFLLLLYLTLPSAERAEQDRYGRHIARRPESWARAGLGYRLPALQRARPYRATFTGWIVRHFLPVPYQRRLARRRESNRIDYRIGFLNVEQRCATVRTLSEVGLDVHGASLMALAVYEEDSLVLDNLATAVVTHRRDVIKSQRAGSLLLWARVWSLCRFAEVANEPVLVDDAVVRSLSGGPWRRRRDAQYVRQLRDPLTSASARIRLVGALANEGLAYHAPSLLGVAAYEEDDYVIQALADAIAKRQWEPVSTSAVSALRLWARGWYLAHLVAPTDVAEEPVAPSVPSRQESKKGFKKKRSLEAVIAPPLYPGGIGRGGPFRVAVTGAGGPAGVAVIRALQIAGHHVLAIDADPHAVGLFFEGVDRGVVPRFSDDSYGSAVVSLITAAPVQALICTVAEEYAPLALIADALNDLGCKTWIPDLDAVALCLDKGAFADAMNDFSISHPPTATTRHSTRNLPGPWIVKPRQGRGSRGFAYVGNARELRRLMRNDRNLIAQSRLEGDEFTADVLIDRNGQFVTCVPRWRLETRGGVSVKGLTFDSEEVTRVCAEVAAATGITGPANIQGMVDHEGAVSIIEMNPRFSGGLPLTLAAGANVVGAYLQAILEPERKIAPLYFDAGVRMTRFFDEAFEVSDA